MIARRAWLLQVGSIFGSGSTTTYHDEIEEPVFMLCIESVHSDVLIVPTCLSTLHNLLVDAKVVS